MSCVSRARAFVLVCVSFYCRTVTEAHHIIIVDVTHCIARRLREEEEEGGMEFLVHETHIFTSFICQRCNLRRNTIHSMDEQTHRTFYFIIFPSDETLSAWLCSAAAADCDTIQLNNVLMLFFSLRALATTCSG